MQGQHVTDQETPVISEKTIEHIVEQKTNIPVGDLKEKEQSQLINLASDLKAHVIGQDDAVTAVAKAVRQIDQSEASSLSDQPVSGRPNCLNNWRSSSLALQTI